MKALSQNTRNTVDSMPRDALNPVREYDNEFETTFDYPSGTTITDLHEELGHSHKYYLVESNGDTGVVKHARVPHIDSTLIRNTEHLYELGKRIGFPFPSHAFSTEYDWFATKYDPELDPVGSRLHWFHEENPDRFKELIRILAKAVLLGLDDVPSDLFLDSNEAFFVPDTDLTPHPTSVFNTLYGFTSSLRYCVNPNVFEVVTAQARDMAVYLIEHDDEFTLAELPEILQYNISYAVQHFPIRTTTPETRTGLKPATDNIEPWDDLDWYLENPVTAPH